MSREKIENNKKDEVPKEFQGAKRFLEDFNYEETKRRIEKNPDLNEREVGLKFIEIIRLYKEGRLKISDTEMWNLFNKVRDYLFDEKLRHARLQEVINKLETAVHIVMPATGDSLKRAYKKFLTEEEIQNRGVNQRGLLEWRMREEVTDRLRKKSEDARKKIEDDLDKLLEQNKE